MMKHWLSGFILLTAFSAIAETNAPPRGGPPLGWSTSVRGGSVYNFETDMDGGGNFSLHRYSVDAGLAYLFKADRMISLSVGYGLDDYDFSGVERQPWNNIENYRVSSFTRWALDEEWSLFAIPSVRSYGEKGSSFDDTLTGAFIGGASYKFSDRLTLGPGFAVAGQIEDDARYFPVLLLDWKITERLSLGTGSGGASSSGPGLTLSYTASKQWIYELSARYERRRFRLDKNNRFAPGGVGEDRNIPITGSITYQLYPGTSLSGIIGSSFGGRLRVEDRSGNKLRSEDYDPAAFAGLILKIRM
ncbi:hypothetical protein SCARR_04283 [Pontiella sulfatireligans]|uniref:Outer membrane protein beta-barrel domain-containing protein n=2 Tax=Pontiella sulfatireligans TaxID=2750658 RepID=A0A6C2USH0_9BACT|nr:hypothetical protein SCARR_04283 [Pontiella sulfatireligans]